MPKIMKVNIRITLSSGSEISRTSLIDEDKLMDEYERDHIIQELDRDTKVLLVEAYERMM